MLQRVQNIKPIFRTGQICWTAGINDTIINDEYFAKFVLNSLSRHIKGDWGDICIEDWQENEISLKQGFRILSAYTNGEQKIWIITEAKRSVTTILFPDEY
jgi:hypothetical protein